jgi:hypothetical protein
MAGNKRKADLSSKKPAFLLCIPNVNLTTFLFIS